MNTQISDTNNSAKPKAIVFDLDGTLYESRHFPFRLIMSNPLHIGYLAAERRCRKKLKAKQFSNADEYYDELFHLMAGSSDAKAEKCRKWFNDIYMPSQIRIIGRDFGPRPHLKKLIAHLKKDYKIGVLSDYGFAEEKLKACGVEPGDFDLIRESPELGGLKPNRTVFEKFCEQLGVAPSEAVMIGDKVSSDGGSLDAGMQFIHIINSEKDRATCQNRSGCPDSNASGSETESLNEKASGSHQYVDLLWGELLELFEVQPQPTAIRQARDC